MFPDFDQTLYKTEIRMSPRPIWLPHDGFPSTEPSGFCMYEQMLQLFILFVAVVFLKISVLSLLQLSPSHWTMQSLKLAAPVPVSQAFSSFFFAQDLKKYKEVKRWNEIPPYCIEMLSPSNPVGDALSLTHISIWWTLLFISGLIFFLFRGSTN